VLKQKRELTEAQKLLRKERDAYLDALLKRHPDMTVAQMHYAMRCRFGHFNWSKR